MSNGGFTRRHVSICAGGAVALLGASPGAAQTQAVGEISHSSAAIHQEVVFAAAVARVFRTLTVAEEFDKVVRLSAAMNSDMKKVLGAAPTAIDAREGGAFSLFGGYITGRFLELVPDVRIVQAWRSGSWKAGFFSIARFGLMPQGPGSKLVFDHTGFPSDAAQHLAQGWHQNYWQPLAESLAS
jgi:activator of HSP90 ATPase